jgi:hypothetical protein
MYENNRRLIRHAFIDMQTVRDAERYNLDLLGDMISTIIEAVNARRLILPPGEASES